VGLLEGKTALITGGSRGIGKSLVETFINEGAQVAFTYRSSASSAEEIVDKLNAGNNLKAYKSDASSFSDSETLVTNVLGDFSKIDILINNAGITKDTLILRMSEEQWDDVMNVNLKSVFNLTKHVVRPMMKNRGGSIINISSVVGIFGNAGQSNYAASKAGIIGFTKSIAKELGSRNIRSNAIAPGFIQSEMTDELDEKVKNDYISNIPLKRFGQGPDVAQACVFLGSDYSSYITGQVLSVCGGMSM
jgi:3-oxoacyl-[acyl-carrier protein] reductase